MNGGNTEYRHHKNLGTLTKRYDLTEKEYRSLY